MVTKLFQIAIVSTLFFSCDNFDDKIRNYVIRTCDLKAQSPCVVDLTQAINVDFDTMYIFSEYSPIEEIRVITGVFEYDDSDWLMPQGFLVQDSHKKVIFIKDRKIVLDQTIEPGWIAMDGGVEVIKTGTFDGEPFQFRAIKITSPLFQVVTSEGWGQGFYLTNVESRTYR